MCSTWLIGAASHSALRSDACNADKKQKDKEAMAELFMNLMYFAGALMIIVPTIVGTFSLVYNRGF